MQKIYFASRDIYDWHLVLLRPMSHSLFTGIEQFYHSHLFQHRSLADTHLWPYKGEKKNKKQKSGKYIQKGILARATTPSDYIVKLSLHKSCLTKGKVKCIMHKPRMPGQIAFLSNGPFGHYQSRQTGHHHFVSFLSSKTICYLPDFW